MGDTFLSFCSCYVKSHPIECSLKLSLLFLSKIDSWGIEKISRRKWLSIKCQVLGWWCVKFHIRCCWDALEKNFLSRPHNLFVYGWTIFEQHVVLNISWAHKNTTIVAWIKNGKLYRYQFSLYGASILN
jgi:hypothetical protein